MANGAEAELRRVAQEHAAREAEAWAKRMVTIAEKGGELCGAYWLGTSPVSVTRTADGYAWRVNENPPRPVPESRLRELIASGALQHAGGMKPGQNAIPASLRGRKG